MTDAGGQTSGRRILVYIELHGKEIRTVSVATDPVAYATAVELPSGQGEPLEQVSEYSPRFTG